MKQVLLFPEITAPHYEASSSHRYLAILKTHDLRPDQLEALTPDMMDWSEEVWLLDFQHCLTYWESQAAKAQKNFIPFLRERLIQIFGDSNYYAVVAPHPWQALLLLFVLEEKGAKGLIAFETQIGQNFYRFLSWEIWWKCCERYVEVSFQKKYHSRKSLTHVKSVLPRMQRSMKCLGIRHPSQLSYMPSHQIRRRFGEIVALLWNLTFSPQDKAWNVKNSLDHDYFFPWTNFKLKEKPFKKRILDYPLIEWNDIEKFLCDDFNALCFLSSFKKNERIIALEWRVVLQDLAEIPITVLFRHPHDLHHEAPHHRTALLQIYYQFTNMQGRLTQHYEELDANPPPIIAWQLKISQTLRHDKLEQNLFSHDITDHEHLLELENRLPIPLLSYELRASWIPEEAYQIADHDSLQHFKVGLIPHEGMASYAMAAHRPIYLYSKPQPLQRNHYSALWRFQERMMDKWWDDSYANDRRDYYRYISEQRSLWVFQNSVGDWYTHGIFA